MATPPSETVLVVATGGTIAGSSRDVTDNVGYTAASLGIEALVAAVPALRGTSLRLEQLVQLDSKDMTHGIWRQLSLRLQAAMADPGVAGVVVTHGTDTLEETAYWLHRTVQALRPVVLTAAMRPAGSLQADGPQNLLDAVTVARHPGARGVVAVLGGQVMAGEELRKVRSYRLDAFSTADAGPVALLEEGRLRCLRDWPQAADLVPATAGPPEPAGPWVESVPSHAGADGRHVDLLVGAGVHGIVVASTGNGTVHRDLDAALHRAREAGVEVLRATRCVLGSLVPDAAPWPGAGGLTPAQARVQLLLDLMVTTRPRRPGLPAT